jgi:hypothetical protein
MYGPNYVKLSRVFAVQLFSMFIGHYAALPPVRSDPHWPHSHAITASIRLALTYTATPAARDSNLGSGNQDMPRLSTPAYLNDAHIHGFADKPLRLHSTDIGCGTLAPRSRQDTATHTARDSNLGSGNQDMPRPSMYTRIPERHAHPRPHRYISSLLPTDIGCGTLAPRSRREHTKHS